MNPNLTLGLKKHYLESLNPSLHIHKCVARAGVAITANIIQSESQKIKNPKHIICKHAADDDVVDNN